MTSRYNPIPAPIKDLEITKRGDNIYLRIATSTDVLNVILSSVEAAILAQALRDDD